MGPSKFMICGEPILRRHIHWNVICLYQGCSVRIWVAWIDWWLAVVDPRTVCECMNCEGVKVGEGRRGWALG